MPWPLNNREIMVKCNGIPVPKNDSCMIVFKSIETPEYFGFQIPEVEPNYVRILIDIGCINLRIRDDNSTHVSLVVRSDP